MPLQFVFGPSGSGKSHYLYHHIIDESILHPESNYVVLVPEQFTMQTQKDLVGMHPREGIMNIDVLSFGRLAYRVFEETGAGSLPVLDDEGKNLILRKIAADYEDQLKVLRGNMKKPGYIGEVKSVISEFTQYDISREEIDQVMEQSEHDSGFYYKLHDMKLLYEGFTAYLEEKYTTKEELLDVLSRVADQSDMLRNSVVALDGFTGFTPVQNRLLLKLMQCCRQVIVTVTIDGRENPYVYQHPYQLFGISKQMTASLIKTAREARIEVRSPVCLYDDQVYRFAGNEAMAFLEHHLFRHDRQCYSQAQSAVSLHVARNPWEEAMAAAASIRRIVRIKGYRYRDIGVIVSDMEAYGDYLERAFELYKIPVFMDHKRSILLNSFVEYLRSLFNMVEQQFSYESVFRFLRTNLAGFTAEETDDLENYVLGTGIRGYKRWQEKWLRRFEGIREEDLKKLNHCRTLLVEKVDTFVYVLRQHSKTVRDITMALYEFMVKEDLQLKLKRQEEVLKSRGELALAREYAQIYRIVLELLDKFVSLLGDEKVSLREYCQLLDAGLEEARVGVIPPSLDQVVAGDVERTRLKDIKVLLFIGANDAYLPGALGRNGLLSEHDREQFARENIALSPGGKEKAYIQKFYLYMNLTKPSEQLEVYYSKVSSDGKSMRPSYLVQELTRLYPELAAKDEEETGLYCQEHTETTAVAYLIAGLRRSGEERSNVWKELYTWYKKNPEWQERLEGLLDAAFYSRQVEGLSRETAMRLYGRDFEDSITRMEKYSACAFAHFLAYGLRLKERKEYEFQAVDLGNVCHSALEKYAKRMEAEGEDWTGIASDKQENWMEECVEGAVSDYGNSVLYSSARNEYMISRIKRILKRTVWALKEQLKAGDFAPSACELKFAGGKIDRVDICQDDGKIYVKVLDYKTGSKAFDILSIYHGLQLQLMVYMDAAVKIERRNYPGREVVPAGAFYYRIQDPIVDKQPEEEIDRSVLKELKPDGMVNLAGDVLEHLEHGREGESLAVPVRFNKNGSLAKGSKALPEEEFRTLMEYAVKKTKDIHDRIQGGDTAAHPYRKGPETGCDYCRYRNICGFDAKMPGYSYNEIEKMSNEEAIAAMKGENES